MKEEHREANLASWDERAPAHATSVLQRDQLPLTFWLRARKR